MTGLRTTSALLALTASGCLLAGCTNPPQLISSPVGQAPVAALDQQRMQNMIATINKNLLQADGAKDVAQAGGRLTGPAAFQRNGDYSLSKAINNAKIEPLPLENNQALTISNSTGWPRYGFSISPAREGKPTYVFSYVQGQAKANYSLWGFVKLFPKVVVPATFKTELGAPQYGSVAKELKQDPGSLAKEYAALLHNAGDERLKALFDAEHDANLQSFTKKVKDYNDALAGVPGVSVDFAAHPSTLGFVSLGTAEGGALVMSSVDYSTTIKSGRPLNLPPVAKVFLGGKTKAKSMMKENHLLLVLFWVPPKDSKDKVIILGAADSTVSMEAD